MINRSNIDDNPFFLIASEDIPMPERRKKAADALTCDPDGMGMRDLHDLMTEMETIYKEDAQELLAKLVRQSAGDKEDIPGMIDELAGMDWIFMILIAAAKDASKIMETRHGGEWFRRLIQNAEGHMTGETRMELVSKVRDVGGPDMEKQERHCYALLNPLGMNAVTLDQPVAVKGRLTICRPKGLS